MNYVSTKNAKSNEVKFFKDIMKNNEKENLIKIIKRKKEIKKINVQIKDSIFNSISH